MTDFRKKMKWRWLIDIRQFNPDQEEHPGRDLTVMRSTLGLSGAGRHKAWIKLDRGVGWASKPGYAKLYFDSILEDIDLTEQPYYARYVNTEATKLLTQTGTELPAGTTLGPRDMVSGFAWLAWSEGVSRRYFTLKPSHQDEVCEYICENLSDDFEVYEDARLGKLCVFPMFASGNARADDFDEAAQFFNEPKLSAQERLDYIAEFENFPMYARFRWG